jgi:hypothetical protein
MAKLSTCFPALVLPAFSVLSIVDTGRESVQQSPVLYHAHTLVNPLYTSCASSCSVLHDSYVVVPESLHPLVSLCCTGVPCDRMAEPCPVCFGQSLYVLCWKTAIPFAFTASPPIRNAVDLSRLGASSIVRVYRFFVASLACLCAISLTSTPW